MTIPAGQEITNLTVNLITANDGGWFGPNATGPGAGGALAAEHLTEPTQATEALPGLTLHPPETPTSPASPDISSASRVVQEARLTPQYLLTSIPLRPASTAFA